MYFYHQVLWQHGSHQMIITSVYVWCNSISNYDSAGKCGRKFRCHILGEPFPRKHSIHTVVSKQKTTGSLLDRKPGKELCWQKRNCVIMLPEISPKKKSLKLNQQKCVSKNSARSFTKLLKLRLYKTKTFHALKDKVYETDRHKISTVFDEELQS
jgi:hypothetical protein